jgi:hypothetical protein
MVQFFNIPCQYPSHILNLIAMIFLINFVGFLIQMVVCPILMLPWLLLRLLVSKVPVSEESAPEFTTDSVYTGYADYSSFAEASLAA